MSDNIRPELRVEEVLVNSGGENITIAVHFEDGSTQNWVLPREQAGRMGDALIRAHLDAETAAAVAQPAEETVNRRAVPTFHVIDLNVVRWQNGGAAIRMNTLEGAELVAAFMPDKVRFLNHAFSEINKVADGSDQHEGLSAVEPPLFPGQSFAQDEFKLITESGAAIDSSEVVFPLVKKVGEGIYKFIGTAFFVAQEGVFATARHVLEELAGDKLPDGSSLVGLHFYGGNQYLERPVVSYAVHPVADVGIGKLADAINKEDGQKLTNERLVLTTEHPPIGEWVFTYAYPYTEQRPGDLEFYPRYYVGRLEEVYPQGRDRAVLPAPCYRSSLILSGGASGAPVFGSSGRVFGIHSSGFKEATISFSSRVQELLEVQLMEVRFSPEGTPESVDIHELVRRGIVLLI
jgi:hypothetical protein